MSSNQSVQENQTAPRVPGQLNTTFFQRVDGIEETVSSEIAGKKSKDKSVTKAKSRPAKELMVLKRSYHLKVPARNQKKNPELKGNPDQIRNPRS